MTPLARLLIQEAAEAHHVTLDALLSPTRGRPEVSSARQMAMHSLRLAGYSNGKTGAVLGRDTSTISHGVLAHRARLRGQP